MPAVTDTVSLIAGTLDGYTYCGDRVYSISTMPSTYYSDVLELDQVTNTLTLGLAGTTTFGHENTYSIEITMAL